MNKSLIHFVILFPTNNKATIVAQPRHRTLNFPSMSITPKRASILHFSKSKISRWGNQFYALFLKVGSQSIRIIRFIAYQTFRFSRQAFKRCSNRYLFVRPRSVKGHCQRNSFAVRHHHKLRTLATPGEVNFRAPFLATTKWPSIKHCVHWIRRRLSNARIKLSQIFSQTPCSSQSLKRLQHVLGLGYCLGKSFQRAPLRNTQIIPSRTSRFFFQGRPLLFNFGSNGSILFHCFSLK